MGLGLGGQGRPLKGGGICSETLKTRRSLSCEGPVVELHLGIRCKGVRPWGGDELGKLG